MRYLNLNYLYFRVIAIIIILKVSMKMYFRNIDREALRMGDDLTKESLKEIINKSISRSHEMAKFVADHIGMFINFNTNETPEE